MTHSTTGKRGIKAWAVLSEKNKLLSDGLSGMHGGKALAIYPYNKRKDITQIPFGGEKYVDVVITYSVPLKPKKRTKV